MARHKPQPGVRDSEGRKIPKKYLRGLSAEKRRQMKKEIKDFRDRPDDDSEAYEPWVADKGAKPKKKSKATKAYHRMYGKKAESVQEDEQRKGRWDITHKDLSRGKMLLVHHPSGSRRVVSPKTARQLRSAIARIERMWDQNAGPKHVYPNHHKHIDAVLEPFFEDVTMELHEVTLPDNDLYLQEDSSKGLAAKAKASGIPLSILKQVFNRGMAAWKTGHRPGVAQQQWAYGRVNSFITGSGGARKADADLWAKARKSKKQEEAMNLDRTPLLAEDSCKGRKKNKPWRTPGGPKKFAVCATDGGKTKLVRFGDPNMEIKRDSKKRRKNFRARHNCDNPGPKTKARYWACKTWEKKKTVKDVVDEALVESDREERRWQRAARRGDAQALNKLQNRHTARMLGHTIDAPEGAVKPRTIRHNLQWVNSYEGPQRLITREPPLEPEELHSGGNMSSSPILRRPTATYNRLDYSNPVAYKAGRVREIHQNIKDMGRVRSQVLRPGKRGTKKRLGEPKWEKGRTPDKLGVLVRNRAMVPKPASRTTRAIRRLKKIKGKNLDEGRMAKALGSLALGTAMMFGGSQARANDKPQPVRVQQQAQQQKSDALHRSMMDYHHGDYRSNVSNNVAKDNRFLPKNSPDHKPAVDRHLAATDPSSASREHWKPMHHDMMRRARTQYQQDIDAAPNAKERQARIARHGARLHAAFNSINRMATRAQSRNSQTDSQPTRVKTPQPERVTTPAPKRVR